MPRFHLVLTHYRPKQTPWKHFQEVQKSNTGLQWVKMEDLTPVNNKVRKNLERTTDQLPYYQIYQKNFEKYVQTAIIFSKKRLQ